MATRSRILVTGMGGDLGSRVATLLAECPDVEAVVGTDLDPPRRRTGRADFRRVDPRDEARTSAVVLDLDPTDVVHLGVYEPNARVGGGLADALNDLGSHAVLRAAADCRSLRRIVVRSGIEVYGRYRGAPAVPDETAAACPTSPFGRQLARVEALARVAGRDADVPVTTLRLASVAGPGLPSPLGRYLRMPAVPVQFGADPRFSLLRADDAAAAVVAALGVEVDGPVNVVGPGWSTPRRALAAGRRLALPITGPSWLLARLATEMLGAPLPAHVRELLAHGRTADGAAAADLLGLAALHPTPAVVDDLYDWPSVEVRTHAAA